MTDSLYRGTMAGGKIRFMYALTTGVANEAVVLHGCDPIVSQIFCRSLCAGVLVSPLLEGDERFTLRWGYEGALRTIVVDVGAGADIRGVPAVNMLHGQVASEQDIYGESGSISVTRSTAERILNAGTTEAALLDVVEDLAFYFCTSDQVETGMRVLIGFHPDPEHPVRLCQGFMVQALPGCDLKQFESFRRGLVSEECTEALSAVPDGDAVQGLVKALGGDVEGAGFSVHECPAPVYRCSCTRERTRDVLKTLSDEDRADILAKGEDVKVRCHFCNEAYVFKPSELP